MDSFNTDLFFKTFSYEGGKLLKNGKQVGANSRKKYTNVSFDGKFYYLHRLIFFYHNHYFPHVVDHIDRNVKNNKIENLRAANFELNALNCSRRELSGVYKINDKSYQARIRTKGKRVSKYFKDLDSAKNWYKEQVKKCWLIYQKEN